VRPRSAGQLWKEMFGGALFRLRERAAQARPMDARE
jgi:hypothetical protein